MSTADAERTIVSHYNLTTAYPTEWPAELDASDDELDARSGARRSKSRYSALERAASDRRTLLPGSQRTGDGKTNLVQKDEPDPLGGSGSVIATLRNRGLPVEQDMRLRNKFLLSSTTFSPALFLSQAHSDASTEELLQGLQNLTKSIDQKAQSLKVLVETNFERFVKAKATIDNVYSEMRNQGVQIAPPSSNQTLRHSRQTSRSSGIHSRNFSSGSATGAVPSAPTPSKNALRKETEYGVQGIKAPLLEVSQRAEDVWGPALGGKEREAGLKSIVDAIQKDRPLYELGGEFGIAVRQKNYERAVELYNEARSYATQATALGERTIQSGQPLTDVQTHKILVTGRMWADVEEQAKSFRRDIWRRLTNAKSIAPGAAVLAQSEHHMELIAILLEIGVEDNPIWVWLLSRYDGLKNKISAIVDRSKVEIEIMRRRLAVADPPTAAMSASYLRHAVKAVPEELDSEEVIDFWKTLLTYVNKLLSPSNGLLSEIVDFWESAQSFIEGNKQKALPTGYQGESRKHHRLSDAGVKDLQNGVVDLVNLIRDALFSLFADAPTEDISSLFSPLGSSAATPSTPFATAFSPSEGRVGNIDELSVPSAAKKGESWEEFAFWPPRSNSLSAVHYLSEILVLTGTGSAEMVMLAPITSNNATYEKVKVMVSAARERCLRAVCEAWSKDAEACKYLEDWLRSPERRNQTRLPNYFFSFEKAILTGMQRVLYLSEAISKQPSREIVSPPPSKLLQMVKTQFVSSIYKALSGMLENAQAVPKVEEDEWALVAESIQSTSIDGSIEAASHSVDAMSRNIRMLLTLSNLKALRNEHVLQLTQLFETLFSVKLTDESKTIKDVFGQVESKLFQSYTKPTVSQLTKTVKDGINSPAWSPKIMRPNQVSPYVYAALMILVIAHTEVSTTVTNSGTSNASLLTEILSFLLENVCQALLDGFKDRKPNTYSLAALIQATLDTEFIAQTMSQYATNKASEIQNNIYIELDKRTTNDARADLQKELGEMRVVLKKLREASRNSFGCFKRPKTGEKDRGRQEKVPA